MKLIKGHDYNIGKSKINWTYIGRYHNGRNDYFILTFIDRLKWKRKQYKSNEIKNIRHINT